MKKKAARKKLKPSAMTSAKKKQISLRITDKEHAKLKKAAEKRGLSLNSFIKMKLKDEKVA